MRRALLLTPLLLAALSAGFGRIPVASCFSCPSIVQGPPCQEYWRADAVFVGLVTEAVVIPWPASNLAHWQPYQKLTARLAVEEAFRGVEGAEVTFEMSDCPFPFKQGERYLVYAHRDKEGRLYQRTGSSRTRSISEAAEDLGYIRGLAQSDAGGRITGLVKRAITDLKLRTDKSEKAEVSGAAAGVKVFAEGEGQTYEAMTDGEGKFEFSGLPEGAYRVRADAPAHHTGGEVMQAKVVSRGCVPLQVWFVPTGEIAGRALYADGQPVSDARVALFSAEGVTDEALADVERSPPVMTFASKEGRYSFTRLPAGRYYIVVSVPNPDKTYRRTFYPNASSLSQAQAINLDGGQKRLNADVQVPPQ